MRISDGPCGRRKSLAGKAVRSHFVSLEPLEPRLLLSAATDLDAEFFKTDAPLEGVIERSVDTEHLFDPGDTESDGVLVLGASSGTPLGENGVWWNWSGSLAIPDGPGGAWVGINCLQPGAIPSNNVVTRVALHHEITHTWIGDLEVVVFNNNHTWVVRDNEGGSDNDINETRNEYTLFDGDNPVQDWYYRVHDTQYLDTGTLDVMQLYVYYDVRVNTAPVIAGVPDVAIDEDTTFPITEESTDDVLGFDADTSVFLALDDGGTPLGDATPTGTSYLLTDFHGGAWSDTEKSPTNTEDDLMCWAAAASNVLEWTGWGQTAGMTTSDQMFAYFQNHWTDEGGIMEYGWDWWFDGSNPSQGWSGWSQVDVAGGAFYPGENFLSYYHEQSVDASALAAIDQYTRAGWGVSLGIYGPGGHAITCWGFNYNPAVPTDYYGIWITDSDDSKSSASPPDLLRYYEVTLTSGRWYLQDYYGSNAWYIGTVQALEPNPDDPDPDPAPDAIDLWAYASDAESDDSALTFTIVANTNPNCGVSIVGNRYLQMNPVANWNGSSNVTIRVSDGLLGNTDTLRVTVSPVNDAPVIDAVPDRSILVSTRRYYALDLWSYAADVDNPDWQLAFAIVGNTQPNCGVSVALGHYLHIIPTTGWTGTSDVTVRVSDGEFTDTDTFSVTVEPAWVDFTAAVAYSILPASPLAGTWGYSVVRVDNGGNAAWSGSMNLQMWATSDGDITTSDDAGSLAGDVALDGVGDYLLSTSRRWMYVSAGGASWQVLYYTLPVGMVADDYRLVCVVDSSGEVTERVEDNNVSAPSTQEYQVRERFIDLTGSFSYFSLPVNTTPGAWGYGIVGVHNGGSVAAAGWISLDMHVDDDGNLANGGSTFMSTSRRYVYVPAGGVSWQVVYYNVPGGLAAGDYQLCLVVDAAGEFTESNETNNTAARATVHHVAGLGGTPLAGAPDVDALVAPIVGFYRAYLGREPDVAGLDAWLAGARGGMSLTAIARGFATSDEFIAIHGDVASDAGDTTFVTWLYRTVLERSAAQAEIDAWTVALDAGGLSRADVMTRFIGSQEYRDRTSPASAPAPDDLDAIALLEPRLVTA